MSSLNGKKTLRSGDRMFPMFLSEQEVVGEAHRTGCPALCLSPRQGAGSSCSRLILRGLASKMRGLLSADDIPLHTTSPPGPSRHLPRARSPMRPSGAAHCEVSSFSLCQGLRLGCHRCGSGVNGAETGWKRQGKWMSSGSCLRVEASSKRG